MCGYQTNDYSLLWLDTHTHIYMTTHSSSLIPTHIYTWLLTPLAWYRFTHIYTLLLTSLAWYPHTYIHDYSTLYQPEEWVVMYMCVWVSTLYQARGVSSHLYIWVGIKPDEWVVMYICVWLVTHIYTWLRTPLSWHRVTHTYTWLLTPLAWYPHTYIHDYSWVVMYICVCGYQAKGVSSHVYMCVWVSSQRSE
jgi:hypothetical protein